MKTLHFRCNLNDPLESFIGVFVCLSPPVNLMIAPLAALHNKNGLSALHDCYPSEATHVVLSH